MAVAAQNVAGAQKNISREGGMPFLLQVSTLTWRSLMTILRSPAQVIPPIIISIFFLLVYQGSFSQAARFIPGLGANYIAFILPFALVSGALSGSGSASQNLVRDIENGYFDKLLLTPVNHAALLLGPILAGGLALAAQTIIVIALGLLLGLQPVTGLLGLVAVLGLAMFLGTGFAGFTVGVALRTGNAAATQSAGILFFPLSFLTAANVPLEQLTGWVRTAATLNPITYILDAMRSILHTGWEGDIILKGLIGCAVMFIIPYVFALLSLRARTHRK